MTPPHGLPRDVTSTNSSKRVAMPSAHTIRLHLHTFTRPKAGIALPRRGHTLKLLKAADPTHNCGLSALQLESGRASVPVDQTELLLQAQQHQHQQLVAMQQQMLAMQQVILTQQQLNQRLMEAMAQLNTVKQQTPPASPSPATEPEPPGPSSSSPAASASSTPKAPPSQSATAPFPLVSAPQPAPAASSTPTASPSQFAVPAARRGVPQQQGRWVAPPSASTRHKPPRGDRAQGAAQPTTTCPVAQAAFQLQRMSGSQRQNQSSSSQPIQLPSAGDVNQVVATAFPGLDAAEDSSLVSLFEALDVLVRAAGTQLTSSNLAELARSLARRTQAFMTAGVTSPAPNGAPANSSATGASFQAAASHSVPQPAAARAAGSTASTQAAAPFSQHVPALLAALSRLVPASVWPQPITARVLDPLHQWSYLDVTGMLLACMEGSAVQDQAQLRSTLAGLAAAASIQQQHAQANGGRASPNQAAKAAPPQLNLLTHEANAVLQSMFSPGGPSPSLQAILKGLHVRHLADGLLNGLTLCVHHDTLQPFLSALVPRLRELDAAQLASVGQALLRLDGPASPSGATPGSSTWDAWPQLFEQASLERLQPASSSSSGGRKGSRADDGGSAELGLDSLAAFAHVLAVLGTVPSDDWLAVFVRRLKLLLGLGVGAPAATGQKAATLTEPVSSTVAIAPAALAQLCCAAATFLLAKPGFQLPSGCVWRLQSSLKALLLEGRSAGTSGPAASGSHLNAVDLIDAMWGLDILGQRPSDVHLNMLVILGTAQLSSLPHMSLVRAVRLATRGASLNTKWWDSLQRMLLASLSGSAERAGAGQSSVSQLQQQQQQGMCVSKQEVLDLLCACASAERLAAASGSVKARSGPPTQQGPKRKASKAGTRCSDSTAKMPGSINKGSGSSHQGVVSPPLARKLLEAAHVHACTGQMEPEEVVVVVEAASALGAVSTGSEGCGMSALLLQQYEAAQEGNLQDGEGETPTGSSVSSSSVASRRSIKGAGRRQQKPGSGSAPGLSIATAERASNVAWLMVQSNYTPSQAWSAQFVADVTSAAPELVSQKCLLRSLGVMHRLKALRALVPTPWLSSAFACVAPPQVVRSASPLELARACIALQQWGGKQQGSGKEEMWSPHVKAEVMQAMVRKLQGGQVKALAVQDVVDVIQVCAHNRLDIGKTLGPELMRVLSNNASSIPLKDLVYAVNAANALQIQGTQQHMEATLQAMNARTHAALSSLAQDPACVHSTSPDPGASDTQQILSLDVPGRLRLLLLVLENCSVPNYLPDPRHLATYMLHIEKLLPDGTNVQELKNVGMALSMLQIHPSERLLERFAAALKSAPECYAVDDALMLFQMLELHSQGTSMSSAFLRVLDVGSQRLWHSLQNKRNNKKQHPEVVLASDLQSQQGFVPSAVLIATVLVLIMLNMQQSQVMELCLEELASNFEAVLALEKQAQFSRQPIPATGDLLCPLLLPIITPILKKVVATLKFEPAFKQIGGQPKDGTEMEAAVYSQPAVHKCCDIVKHLERWALLKLPLLSSSQIIDLCLCYRFVGLAPSSELVQQVQPQLLSGLQATDPDQAFDLMVLFHDRFLTPTTTRDETNQAAVQESGGSSGSKRAPPSSCTPKASVQEGAHLVCCAALERVLALKEVDDEGEVKEPGRNSAPAALQIWPGMKVEHLIMALEYMKELGVGPYSAQWQDVLQKSVATMAIEQDMPPEALVRLAQATMAIMPEGHVYSSWWSAALHLASAQMLVNDVPEDVAAPISAYIHGSTEEDARRADQDEKAQAREAIKFFEAQQNEGRWTRQEQQRMQASKEKFQHVLRQPDEQQQSMADGTTYGIPSKPGMLPPYSEAVLGLDEMQALFSSLEVSGMQAQGSSTQEHKNMTIDVNPQGDGSLGPQLLLPPSRAASVLSMCLTLPHTPRREWMAMLWHTMLPSLKATAEAGEGQQGSWFNAEQHWDLRSLAMLGLLSMRASYYPGQAALEVMAQASATQLPNSGVPPQTAIAVLQTLVYFRCNPGEAWLCRFIAATQPTLPLLTPSETTSSPTALRSVSKQSSPDPQTSAALASVLACFAAIQWVPPMEWMTLHYTVLHNGNVPLLSHGQLWSISTCLVKIITLQAQRQAQSSSTSGEDGHVDVPTPLIDLLAHEIVARCTGDSGKGDTAAHPEIGPDDAEKLTNALELLRKL